MVQFVAYRWYAQVLKNLSQTIVAGSVVHLMLMIGAKLEGRHPVMRATFEFGARPNGVLRSRCVFVCVVLFAALVIGCGGGGSGVPTGEFVYRTAWGTQVQGASQIVALFDADEEQVATQVVRRSEGQSVSFGSLAAGRYRLVSTLYSGDSGTGSVLGEIDTYVDVEGPETFRTAVTGEVTQVLAVPQAVQLQSQTSTRLSATPATADGTALFVPEADLTWEVLGGIGTLAEPGLFVAGDPGAGSVRITHVPSGIRTSIAITVQAFQATTTEWTVMVFMNAANDLFQFSDLNVNQMETVANNPDLRFVVQWKQSKDEFASSSFDGTRRYLVTPGSDPNRIESTLLAELGPTDMGDAATLNQFISWAKQHYPARRYALIVWNHGNGWRRSANDDLGRAVSYDDETGNAIQIWELDEALQGHSFDVLAWDASLMQMFEVAYEVREHADYVVGSQESPPGEGYPYALVFDSWRTNPNAATRTLTKSFVDGMLANPPYASRKITQSVIDTSKLPDLATALDNYAAALIANAGSLGTVIPTARDRTQRYSASAFRYFFDLIDLTEEINNVGVPSAVANSGQALANAAQAALVWEGHNAQSPGSRGIAVDFSPADRFTASETDYKRLKLAQDTRWDEWLKIAP